MIIPDFKHDIDHIKFLIKVLDYKDGYFEDLVKKLNPNSKDKTIYFNVFLNEWTDQKIKGECCCRISFRKNLTIEDYVRVIKYKLNEFLNDYYNISTNANLGKHYLNYNKGNISIKDVPIYNRPFIFLENSSYNTELVRDYMIENKVSLKMFVNSVRNSDISISSLKRARRISLNLMKYSNFFIIDNPGINITDDMLDYRNNLDYQIDVFAINCQLTWDYLQGKDHNFNLNYRQESFIVKREDVVK